MNFTDAQLNDLKRLFNQIQTEVYGLDTVELEGANLVPAETNVGQWIDSLTYKVATVLGMARLISDYTDDFPPVSRAYKMMTAVIKEFGCSYAYSEPELMQWLTAGVDVSRDGAFDARETIDVKNDNTILVGDSEAGFQGLVNNENVTVINAGTGAGGDNEWSKKTVGEIQADIQSAIDTQRAATKKAGNLKPDSIVLPHAAFIHVSTTKIANDSSSMTILDYLKTVYREQGIVNWSECSALDGVGVGGSDRAILYRKDRKCLAYVMPIPFRQKAPQEQGIYFKVPCYTRMGGTIIKRPTTIVYIDGV